MRAKARVIGALVIAIQTLSVSTTAVAHAAAPRPGADPGNIRTAANPDAAAAARAHRLAVFAAGCFWHVEDAFRRTRGVTATAVGYTGGDTPNPTYEMVCSHRTGHAEAVLVEYDPAVTSYSALVRVFFASHDPTTANRQGPDVGSNYRSAIFARTPDQEATAQRIVATLQRSGRYRSPIVTQIRRASAFYVAEPYHQQYYERTGVTACPAP